jgi:hypothetical protein
MYVDKNACKKCAKPDFELKTFYGQLEHIFLIRFPCACEPLGLNASTTIIFAAIRTCKLNNNTNDESTHILNVHYYTNLGTLDVIDITSIQALVGCVRTKVDGNQWAIIDQSSSLAHAIYEPAAENHHD